MTPAARLANAWPAVLTAALSVLMVVVAVVAMTPEVDAEPVASGVRVIGQLDQDDVGPAPAVFWCSYRRPHSGDKMHPGQNYWRWMSEDALTARCLAYEGTYPNGLTRLHYYHVTIWDADHDGVVERVTWAPMNPITW